MVNWCLRDRRTLLISLFSPKKRELPTKVTGREPLY